MSPQRWAEKHTDGNAGGGNKTMESQVRSLSGINILAGIWLIISPFILGYNSTGNSTQQIIFGAIVLILGIVRMALPNATWPSWVNFIIGLWIIIAPWTMATVTAARWNEVITGIVVALFAYSSGAVTANIHRHHTAAH